MGKEYTVTNGASGVDLYPKDKFDSNKTIGVLLGEAAGKSQRGKTSASGRPSDCQHFE
jgi:hypothetical protein